MMKYITIFVAFGLVAGDAGSTKVSPVQKVIEMLQEYKVKVQADLDAETKEMATYTDYCDKESSDRAYAIKTATRDIAELTGTIADGSAQVAKLTDDIATLGTTVAGKEAELAEATSVRSSEKADFQASEKELLTSVDQLERAVVMIKRGTNQMALLQGAKGAKGAKDVKKAAKDPNADLKMGLSMISKVLDAGWVNAGTKKSLQAMIQTTISADDKEDAGLVLNQPQPKVSAYESHSGGIVGQIEEMKEKAEDTLSSARNGEMKEQHNYDMMAQSLTDAISINKEKTSEAKSLMAQTKEETGKAKAELAETEKSKAADEKFLETLTLECSEAQASWAERQKSAAGEMAALDKAKEILASKVTVFFQKRSPTDIEQHWNDMTAANDDMNKELDTRHKIEKKLKALNKKFPSYGLMQLVSQAGAGPFDKVKGLITDMITKLVNEANADATQKQFCDEEMAKSKDVQDDKTMTSDKLSARIDKAATTKAKLTQLIGELEGEIAKLDAGTAEATSVRTSEHETYLKASADYKQATEAVSAAIGVLKEYYASVFLVQTKTSKANKAPPALGGAKSDAANTIISILEMCEENFSKLYMETETDEQTAKMAYDKLMNENKVAKAAKSAEVKGSLSEIKSLDVTLRNSKEDYDMTQKELDAVMAYMEKLKPQCETKVMSYAEKKAAREAEIEGLKEALSILDTEALVQVRHLRARVHA